MFYRIVEVHWYFSSRRDFRKPKVVNLPLAVDLTKRTIESWRLSKGRWRTVFGLASLGISNGILFRERLPCTIASHLYSWRLRNDFLLEEIHSIMVRVSPDPFQCCLPLTSFAYLPSDPSLLKESIKRMRTKWKRK